MTGMMAVEGMTGVIWNSLFSTFVTLTITLFTRKPRDVAPRNKLGGLTARGLGAFAFMGLALLGAVLLVVWHETTLGAGLAIYGPLLAVLSVWGGDLLWLWRSKWATITFSSSVPVALLGLITGMNPSSAITIFLAALWASGTGLLLSSAVARARFLALRARVQGWQVLLALAVLVRVPVPLVPDLFPLIGTVQTVLITLVALLWGWRIIGARVLALGILAFSLGLAVEYLGSRTGIPFGCYSYSEAPAPTLLGVPLIVPLGWFALVLSAHVLARGNPVLTGLGVVAWDLGLEALMPQQHYWHWTDPNPLWYGAPLENYLAWFGVGALISLLFRALGPELHQQGGLDWAYKLEALFIPVGLALFGLWPAALLCGLTMNIFAWHSVLVRRVPARVLK